jgi:uncharacterized protein (TIGR03437 family)
VAAPAAVNLTVVSGDRQMPGPAGALPDPIVVLVSDANNLPYPGARVLATPSAGGSVDAAAAATAQDGTASFRWTPGSAGVNRLQLTVEGAPAATVSLTAGSAVVLARSVVNAASSVPGMAPGAIATIYGNNLAVPGGAPTAVLVNGNSVPVLFAGAGQVNFFVPENTPVGDATVSVAAPGGTSAPLHVTVSLTLPGIFPDGNNRDFGAILNSGTAVTTSVRPARRGDYVEIYCTGLGVASPDFNGLLRTLLLPAVYINGTPALTVFSGMVAAYPGLYQVNVQVPASLPPGPRAYPLSILIGGVASNEVKIGVE